ncbi:MAG: hypothetical protein EAZ13_06545 [Sphingobacteriia bacterium]|nr:MAG: hypothetical protein EAZ41_09555 [Sphingobacteriia bacterium]TAG30096.1 MAG: hypothetical protein EAZ35_08420 [Sphingobacteriia bacterium]TAH07325.1 MAG: hypothetical protein EAZ13_06545 [Sphingobacteriia bacterium]
MKLAFTLTAFIALSIHSSAQKITGIWRGYFSSSNGIYREGTQPEMYKYELQIDQQTNNGLKGVTYSYKTTVFYGKANIQGIYNITSKTILLKETGLVDLKISDKSEPCLMTCYLDYSKIGKLEVLQGSFISTNIKDKGDCGNGKVYLEKVTESDFELEPFLAKKGSQKKADDTAAKKATIIPKQSVGPATANKSPLPTNKPLIPKAAAPIINAKPPISAQAIRVNKPKPKAPKNTSPSNPTTLKDTAIKLEPELVHQKRAVVESEVREKRAVAVPKVLQERENNLVKTLVVEDEDIQIDLFDNGTIDNDTISVYHNNELVVRNGRLAFKAISFKIKCSPKENMHELVIVAENLGEIPPNTALMVITAGRKRYEVFLSSTEKRNAKVVIEYISRKAQ